jgi:hypothetical protein
MPGKFSMDFFSLQACGKSLRNFSKIKIKTGRIWSVDAVQRRAGPIRHRGTQEDGPSRPTGEPGRSAALNAEPVWRGASRPIWVKIDGWPPSSSARRGWRAETLTGVRRRRRLTYRPSPAMGRRRGDAARRGELGGGRDGRSERQEKDLRDGHGEVHLGACRDLTPASLDQRKGRVR